MKLNPIPGFTPFICLCIYSTYESLLHIVEVQQTFAELSGHSLLKLRRDCVLGGLAMPGI